MRWNLEIQESMDTPKYRQTIESYMAPVMDWLCARIAEEDITKFEKAEDLIKQIMDELPVMKLRRRSDFSQNYSGPDFYIEYNRYADIYFEDSAVCIRRDAVIENILKK